MAGTIDNNWLEAFKLNLQCGNYPSKTMNPMLEMLTGLVGIRIEHLVCRYPTALDDSVATGSNVATTPTTNLANVLSRIKCGQLFPTKGEAVAALAMVENIFLQMCSSGTEGGEDNVRTITTATGVTLAATDDVVVINNAAAQALNVPLNATVPIPVGKLIEIHNIGAGDVTITPEGGVTITPNADLVMNATGGVAYLRKVAINTWTIFGNLG